MQHCRNRGDILRVKITASTSKSVFIPFNYNYALHSAVYNLIKKSSEAYSAYLHDKGFLNNAIEKRFKLFTFSKLFFKQAKIQKNGFSNVRETSFFFSTPIEQSYEHLILGLFSDQTFFLNFSGEKIIFAITRVEAMPQPAFINPCRFVCLSPIAVSTQRPRPDGALEQHYLDYMNPEERPCFIDNIRKNLINKFETFHNKSYFACDTMQLHNKDKYNSNGHFFSFNFDVDYITKRQGRISKLIHFKRIKNNHTSNCDNKKSDSDIRTKIKAFEAPFTIIADPELVKIGYDAGFGNDNSAGLGCADIICNDSI